jgi:hypothetical protein
LSRSQIQPQRFRSDFRAGNFVEIAVIKLFHSGLNTSKCRVIRNQPSWDCTRRRRQFPLENCGRATAGIVRRRQVWRCTPNWQLSFHHSISGIGML